MARLPGPLHDGDADLRAHVGCACRVESEACRRRPNLGRPLRREFPLDKANRCRVPDAVVDVDRAHRRAAIEGEARDLRARRARRRRAREGAPRANACKTPSSDAATTMPDVASTRMMPYGAAIRAADSRCRRRVARHDSQRELGRVV